MNDMRTGGRSRDEIAADLAFAFAPLHKRALGMAVGTVVGLAIAVGTIGALVRPEASEFMSLLGNFFPAYTVSVPGAVVGLLWGMFCGFVLGWFTAFVRNLVLAGSIWLARAKAEFAATRDFLDHI